MIFMEAELLFRNKLKPAAEKQRHGEKQFHIKGDMDVRGTSRLYMALNLKLPSAARSLQIPLAQSGESIWTVEAAKDLVSPAPAAKGSLNIHLEPRKTPSYKGKIVSALQNQLGGHEMKEKKG